MESSSLEQPIGVCELPEFNNEQKDEANSSNRAIECITLSSDEDSKDGVEAKQSKKTGNPASVSSPKHGSSAQSTEYRCSTPETFEEFMSKNSQKCDSPSRMPTKPWASTNYGYSTNSPVYMPPPDDGRPNILYNPDSPHYLGPPSSRLSIPNSPALSDFADQLSTPKETDKAEPAVAVTGEKATIDSDGDEPAAKKFKPSSENMTAGATDKAK